MNEAVHDEFVNNALSPLRLTRSLSGALAPERSAELLHELGGRVSHWLARRTVLLTSSYFSSPVSPR